LCGGSVHSYDPEAVREVADFYKGPNTHIGAKKPHRRPHPQGD